MARYGVMFGPDFTFFGVPQCDLSDPATYAASRAVIIGAPWDSATSYRSGARFGPSAIRGGDYSHHSGSRPHLALRVDPLVDLSVTDAGDVRMPPAERPKAMAALESAVRSVVSDHKIPVVLGGDHSVAVADMTALADHFGQGRIALIHFDAHADTGDTEFGSLHGHGSPMRRLVESGAVRGDRLFQIGLRGYWPGPDDLAWMAGNGLHSYEMAEIGARGLESVLTEVLTTAADDTDGVFLSVDIDVVDPGTAPGTGTPEPGGLTARELLDAVRRIGRESALVGMEIVELAPAYDHADITAMLANRVVLETLSGVARKASDAAAGERWDESTSVLAGREAVAVHRDSGD